METTTKLQNMYDIKEMVVALHNKKCGSAIEYSFVVNQLNLISTQNETVGESIELDLLKCLRRDLVQPELKLVILKVASALYKVVGNKHVMEYFKLLRIQIQSKNEEILSECINLTEKIVPAMLLSNEFNAEEFLLVFKAKLTKIETILQIGIIGLSPQQLIQILVFKVIPVMFETIHVEVRKVLINLVNDLNSVTSIDLLGQEQLEQFKENMKNSYVGRIHHVKQENDPDWHKLWMFLVKFCGSKLHDDVDTMNRLLRIIEDAFRDPLLNMKLMAHDCWKVLIGSYGTNKKSMCQPKQIKLLVTPLRAKITKRPELIMRKFSSWCDLLSLLNSNCSIVLQEFLNFCYGCPEGNFANITENSNSGHSPILKDCSLIFLEILGCSKERSFFESEKCILNLSKSVITPENIVEYEDVLLHSLFKCSIFLPIWATKEQAEQFAFIAWKAFFNILSDSPTSVKEVVLSKFFKYLPHVIMRINSKPNMLDVINSILRTLFSAQSLYDIPNFHTAMWSTILESFSKLEDRILSCEPLMVYVVQTGRHLKHNLSNYIAQICSFFSKFDSKKQFTTIFIVWLRVVDVILSRSDEEDIFQVHLSGLTSILLWPLSQHSDKELDQQIISYWRQLLTALLKFDGFKEKLASELAAASEKAQWRSGIADFLMLLLQIIKLPENPKLGGVLIKITANSLKKLEGCESNFLPITKALIDSSFFKANSNNLSDSTENMCFIFKCYFKEEYASQCLLILNDFIDQTRENSAIISKLFSTLRVMLFNLTKHKDQDVSKEAVAVRNKLKGIFDSHQVDDKSSNMLLKRGALLANLGKSTPLSPMKPVNTEINKSGIRLFGCDIDTMSPVPLKGSVLNSSTTAVLSEAKKEIESENKCRTTPGDEEYVVIDSEYQFDPKKLSEHQLEVLKKRRDDIPACYQDWTQSLSSCPFDIESNSSAFKIINETSEIQTEIKDEIIQEIKDLDNTIEDANFPVDFPIQEDHEISSVHIPETPKEVVTESPENSEVQPNTKKRKSSLKHSKRKSTDEEHRVISEVGQTKIVIKKIENSDSVAKPAIVSQDDPQPQEGSKRSPRLKAKQRSAFSPDDSSKQIVSKADSVMKNLFGTPPVPVTPPKMYKAEKDEKLQKFVGSLFNDSPNSKERKRRTMIELDRIRMDLVGGDELLNSVHLDSNEKTPRKRRRRTFEDTVSTPETAIKKRAYRKKIETVAKTVTPENVAHEKPKHAASSPKKTGKPSKKRSLSKSEEEEITESQDIVESSQSSSSSVPISLITPKRISRKDKKEEKNSPCPLLENAVTTDISENDTLTCDSNLTITPAEPPDLQPKTNLTDSQRKFCEMDTYTYTSQSPTQPDQSGLPIPIDKTIENNSEEILATPVKTAEKTVLPIATSPVTVDTPTKNNELLSGTAFISPIRKESLEKTDVSSSLFKPDEVAKPVTKQLNSRSAKLLDLVSPTSKSLMIRTTTNKIAKPEVKVTPSPRVTRMRKIIMLGQEKDSPPGVEDSPEEKRDTDENCYLNFDRPLPSCELIPQSSILKRKMPDSLEDGISPKPKRNRVSFSDPTTTSEKIFIPHNDEHDEFWQTQSLTYKRLQKVKVAKSSRRAIFRSLNPGNENIKLTPVKAVQNLKVNIVPDTVPDGSAISTVLNDSESIYPRLVDCADDTSVILGKIVSPIYVEAIETQLKHKKVTTVGDIASMTEVEVNRLPIQSPKVSKVYNALDEYYKQTQQIVQDDSSLSSSMAELESPASPITEGQCIEGAELSTPPPTEDQNSPMVTTPTGTGKKIRRTSNLLVSKQPSNKITKASSSNDEDLVNLLTKFCKGRKWMQYMSEVLLRSFGKRLFIIFIKHLYTKHISENSEIDSIDQYLKTAGPVGLVNKLFSSKTILPSKILKLISQKMTDEDVASSITDLQCLIQRAINVQPSDEILKALGLHRITEGLSTMFEQNYSKPGDFLQMIAPSLSKTPEVYADALKNLTAAQIADITVQSFGQDTEKRREFIQNVNDLVHSKDRDQEEETVSSVTKYPPQQQIQSIVSSLSDQDSLQDCFEAICDKASVQTVSLWFHQYLKKVLGGQD